MWTITCRTNWSGDIILRVTFFYEELFISRLDCAVVINEIGQQIEPGYALYLLDSSYLRQSTTWQDVFVHGFPYCVLPNDIALQPGQFLHVFADGKTATIHILQTDDLPDRTLFLTGKCNSNCIMCPYTSRWREKADNTPLQFLLRYIELMNPYAPYLCVTGGEPTILKDEFIKVLLHVKAHFKYCLLHIMTNGRAFYYSDFFEVYKISRPLNTLLGIPIYAHTSELHDAITLVPGSFEETLVGLDRLYVSGEHVELRIVLTALNVSCLVDFARFVHEKYPNIYMVSIMGLEMVGNAYKNRKNVWINFDDVTEMLTKTVDYLVSNGIQTQIYNMPLCKVNRRHWALCQKSISAEKVAFYPECEKCVIRSTCGGFFNTTIHMPDITITPLLEA